MASGAASTNLIMWLYFQRGYILYFIILLFYFIIQLLFEIFFSNLIMWLYFQRGYRLYHILLLLFYFII